MPIRARLGICAASVLALARVDVARAQASCTASPLSSAEAEQLLDAIPSAVAAAQRGAKLVARDWNPGDSYRRDLFYFAAFYATGLSDADGGLLGYFAVNKLTGVVFDLSVPPGESVTGAELAGLQTTLRWKHCIGVRLLVEYEDTLPYSTD